MKSLFRGDVSHPYHLSVGIVLLKDQNTIYLHHYTNLQKEGDDRTLKNVYTLFRETLEPSETLEEAVKRGLQEELGASGEILAYIGSRKTSFLRDGISVEKTTLYFVVQCIGTPTFETDENIGNTYTQVEEQDIDHMIPIMQSQESTTGESNFNESEILQKVKIFLKKKYVT